MLFVEHWLEWQIISPICWPGSVLDQWHVVTSPGNTFIAEVRFTPISVVVTNRDICCVMVHIKEPLLLIGMSNPCGGSGFPLTPSGPLPHVGRYIAVKNVRDTFSLSVINSDFVITGVFTLMMIGLLYFIIRLRFKINTTPWDRGEIWDYTRS